MKFRATIRYWRPESRGGLAVADVPSEYIAHLGGLKQVRVRGKINRAEYVSNVMPAGSGRLALSVSKTMMAAAGVTVGDEAAFEIERVASAQGAGGSSPAKAPRRPASPRRKPADLRQR